MKSFKRLVVFMLVLSMVIGTMVPAFAFSDVEDTYYEDEINKLAAVGVVNGDPEGTFRPDDNITRAEVAVIICKMLGAGNTMDAQKNMPSKFSDVAVGEWYTGAVNLATDIGVIAGFPDGTFRPNDNITVAQAVTLMVNALGRKVYVEKAGEWPANYIAEGAKLGVTKNVVAGAQDDLATRGVVSAMSWNSLDIPVWDVYETTHAGEIVSSATETMLVKYFKDYVTEIKTVGYGTEGGELKWAEDVVVKANHHTLNTIAEGQILVDMDDITDDVATFEAKTKNRVKDEEKATYSINNATQLVVYVADKNVSTTSLLNKTVDIMFGKDNVATLVIVTDEVEDDMLTKYLADDNKIVVGSEEYKLAEKVEMSINYQALEEDDPHVAIPAILAEVGAEVGTRAIKKAIKVNVTLDDNDKVAKISFFVSGNFEFEDLADDTIVVNQLIVEEVKDDEIIVVDNSSDVTDIDLDELKEADDVITVIKDGEEASLDDIAAGDVITYTGDIETATVMYVSSAKVTGTADSIKTASEITIDGTTYFANDGFIGDLSKDIKDAASINLSDVVGEEVELYLNFLGEYVAVLADTEGGDYIFGLVKKVTDPDVDVEEYAAVEIRVLTEKGESKLYNIVSEDEDVQLDEIKGVDGEAYGLLNTTNPDVLVDAFIAFKVSGENNIKAEDMYIIDEEAINFEKVGGEDYTVAFGLPTPGVGEAKTADYDDREISVNNGTDDVVVEFNDDTVIFNIGGTTEEKMEIVTAGFKAIVSEDDETIVDDTAIVVYDENDDIKFIVLTGDAPYVSTESDYALVMDMELVKDDAYEVTLYVEGETKVYETKGAIANIDFATGDFIKYEVTGAGKLDLAIEDDVCVSHKVIDIAAINALKVDAKLGEALIASFDQIDSDEVGNAYVTKKHLTVDEVTTTTVKFDKVNDEDIKGIKFQKDDDKFDGIIYDLRDENEPKMVTDINELDGKAVFAIKADSANTRADLFIIVKR